jgi:hypothetical protein
MLRIAYQINTDKKMLTDPTNESDWSLYRITVETIKIKEVPTTRGTGNALCEFTIFVGKSGCYSKPIFDHGIAEIIAIVMQKC